MKPTPHRSFLLPFIAVFAACAGSLAAQPVAETFDQKPAPAAWNLSAQAKVLDGELLLPAAGPAEGYPTTALVSKAGNAALNFTVQPVELTLTGIGVAGTAAPASSVFMAILTADLPNEMKARSYLKLRISADGTLLLNCAEIGGDRTRETTLYKTTVKLPVRRLSLRLSAENFQIKGIDAARPFEQSSGWNGRLDLAAWQGATPFVIVKGVRRPGEGEADVRLGDLKIAPAQ